MPRTRKTFPAYRLHKQSGQAVVTLTDLGGERKDVLLGRFDSPESRTEYDRAIAEWVANGRRLTAPAPDQVARPGLTVAELLLAWDDHAQRYYRKPDGTPTGELSECRLSLRLLRELYGHTRAADFTPLALKALREAMVKRPITTRVKRLDLGTDEVTWAEKVLRVGLARGVINQRVERVKRVFAWG